MKTALRSALTAAALLVPVAVSAATPIVMHRDPGCGCCAKWAAQVQQQLGRQVRVVDDSNRPALQKRAGVPADVSSCHTAIADGMAFEGHVPIADMKRALATRPKGVRGLAVGGMPLGSPGMEVPGVKAQAYDVVAFGPGGRRLFSGWGRQDAAAAAGVAPRSSSSGRAGEEFTKGFGSVRREGGMRTRESMTTNQGVG